MTIADQTRPACVMSCDIGICISWLWTVWLDIVDRQTVGTPKDFELSRKADVVVTAHAVLGGHVTVIIILLATNDSSRSGCWRAAQHGNQNIIRREVHG